MMRKETHEKTVSEGHLSHRLFLTFQQNEKKNIESNGDLSQQLFNFFKTIIKKEAK